MSDISYAEELGVEIVKVFPGDSVGGPPPLKSILRAMPVDTHHANRRRGSQPGKHLRSPGSRPA